MTDAFFLCNQALRMIDEILIHPEFLATTYRIIKLGTYRLLCKANR